MPRISIQEPHSPISLYMPLYPALPLRDNVVTEHSHANPLPFHRESIFQRLAKLQVRFLGLSGAFAKELDECSTSAVPLETSAEADGLKGREPRELQYRLYDSHFQVYRVPGMPGGALACQFSNLATQLLADLPTAVLGRDSLFSLVNGMEAALNVLPSAPPISAEPLFWESGGLEKTARFRWRTGHYLFALWNHLGQDAFQRAEQLIEDPEASAHEIDRARCFLAATSASMEYATNFPSKFYAEILRPETDAAPMPGGFSGTQNSDYNHMKLQKGRLQAHLVLRYGRDVSHWPEPLQVAVESYRQQDLLDLDVHIRVAANMVQLGQSLKQKMAHQGAINALTALRAMAIVRSHDFGL